MFKLCNMKNIRKMKIPFVKNFLSFAASIHRHVNG